MSYLNKYLQKKNNMTLDDFDLACEELKDLIKLDEIIKDQTALESNHPLVELTLTNHFNTYGNKYSLEDLKFNNSLTDKGLAEGEIGGRIAKLKTAIKDFFRNMGFGNDSITPKKAEGTLNRLNYLSEEEQEAFNKSVGNRKYNTVIGGKFVNVTEQLESATKLANTLAGEMDKLIENYKKVNFRDVRTKDDALAEIYKGVKFSKGSFITEYLSVKLDDDPEEYHPKDTFDCNEFRTAPDYDYVGACGAFDSTVRAYLQIKNGKLDSGINVLVKRFEKICDLLNEDFKHYHRDRLIVSILNEIYLKNLWTLRVWSQITPFQFNVIIDFENEIHKAIQGK